MVGHQALRKPQNMHAHMMCSYYVFSCDLSLNKTGILVAVLAN